jgi:hypothetical protein
VLAFAASLLVAAGSSSPTAVVHAWSKALNTNRNVAAARLFAPNARVIQPGVDVVLTSRALAIGFNDALPCAGRIVAMQVRGDRVVATFVLGRRPKHYCSSPGVKAAALFVIRSGKITLWKQVAVPNPNAGKPAA